MIYIFYLFVLCCLCTTQAIYVDQIGEFEWSFQALGFPIAALSKADSLLVLSEVNLLARLDKASGDLIWRVPLPANEATKHIALGKGVVFTFAPENGAVRCFDAETGAMLWNALLPEELLFPSLALDDRDVEVGPYHPSTQRLRLLDDSTLLVLGKKGLARLSTLSGALREVVSFETASASSVGLTFLSSPSKGTVLVAGCEESKAAEDLEEEGLVAMESCSSHGWVKEFSLSASSSSLARSVAFDGGEGEEGNTLCWYSFHQDTSLTASMACQDLQTDASKHFAHSIDLSTFQATAKGVSSSSETIVTPNTQVVIEYSKEEEAKYGLPSLKLSPDQIVSFQWPMLKEQLQVTNNGILTFASSTSSWEREEAVAYLQGPLLFLEPSDTMSHEMEDLLLKTSSSEEEDAAPSSSSSSFLNTELHAIPLSFRLSHQWFTLSKTLEQWIQQPLSMLFPTHKDVNEQFGLDTIVVGHSHRDVAGHHHHRGGLDLILAIELSTTDANDALRILWVYGGDVSKGQNKLQLLTLSSENTNVVLLDGSSVLELDGETGSLSASYPLLTSQEQEAKKEASNLPIEHVKLAPNPKAKGEKDLVLVREDGQLFAFSTHPLKPTTLETPLYISSLSSSYGKDASNPTFSSYLIHPSSSSSGATKLVSSVNLPAAISPSSLLLEEDSDLFLPPASSFQTKVLATLSVGSTFGFPMRTLDYAHVTGDASLLLRYLNPHLQVVVSQPCSPAYGQCSPSLSVSFMDTVSGRVLYSTDLPSAEGPVHLSSHLHTIVLSYWNPTAKREQLEIFQLFEAAVQKDALNPFTQPSLPPSFSSYVHPNPLVQRQSLILPSRALSLSFSKTRFGITPPHLLIATVAGQLYSIHPSMLDVRRVRTEDATLIMQSMTGKLPTPDDEKLKKKMESLKAEGIPFYTSPFLQVMPHQAIVSTNHSLPLAQSLAVTVASSPTRLESTSLVLLSGIDLLFLQVKPSKGFDVLPIDFQKLTLGITMSGLFLALSALRLYMRRRDMKELWA